MNALFATLPSLLPETKVASRDFVSWSVTYFLSRSAAQAYRLGQQGALASTGQQGGRK
jgi:hypothetical protein